MKSFHARVPKLARKRPQPDEGKRPAHAQAGMPRADALLVARGLASSRAGAQRLIKAGCVVWFADDGPHVVNKPSLNLPANAKLGIEDEQA